MPVATVVGGTPKLSTMPLRATGSDATLNDMIAWPKAIAIMGTHDSRSSPEVMLADDVEATEAPPVMNDLERTH